MVEDVSFMVKALGMASRPRMRSECMGPVPWKEWAPAGVGQTPADGRLVEAL